MKPGDQQDDPEGAEGDALEDAQRARLQAAAKLREQRETHQAGADGGTKQAARTEAHVLQGHGNGSRMASVIIAGSPAETKTPALGGGFRSR